MRISEAVLLEALAPFARWHSTLTDPAALYAFPLRCAGTDAGRGHVLILSPDQAHSAPGRDSGALAVFTAPPPPGLLSDGCPALIPDAALDDALVWQCLTGLYDRLERWAEALSACSPDLPGVRQMLERSAAEMQGDFVLIDVSYHIPAFTDTGAGGVSAVVDTENGRAAEQSIAILADNPRISEIARVKGVQLYESTQRSRHDRRALYRNMFRPGETVFYNRLLFYRLSEQYGEADRFMLELLVQRVERVTEHLLTYDVPLSRFLALKQQLLRIPLPESSFDPAAISALGWREDDDYCFYIFRSFYSNRDDGISDFILRSLEQLIPGSCGAMDGDRILLLQNVSRCGITRDNLRQRLSLFLRENLYKVGISNVFHPLRLVKGAFCQSAAALERLRRIDREKGTDYTETLRVLSEVNFNTTHAAQALFIHRTTLQSRLDRIGQLSGLDLGHRDVRFLLQFSFRLLAGTESTA